jgi:phosphatidate cytidylyltransferase
MAFNWQTFKTRTLTAAVFVIVMLAGLLINQWTFFILFSIIHFGCWWEYLRLTEKIYGTTISKFGKFLIMDIGYVLFWLIGFKDHETPALKIAPTAITISEALIFLMLAGIILFLFLNKKIALKAKWMFLGGLIYISLSLGLMIDLYAKTFLNVVSNYTDVRIYDTMYVLPPYFYPIAIISSIWINDTMAYVIGSLVGKTTMSKISPKKTWEGTIGGIILCVTVIGFISFLWIDQKTFIIFAIIISAIVSVAGTFGDLLESKLKRMAGVKDSGHIMPGHGGFLDRFDSMLLAIPAVWLYVYFFMR